MPTNVLLVDDDVNLLRGLARNLRNQPYHLFTARSAEDAMPILKAHPIAVVVSDERMPGKSGSEMFTWMATNCPEIVRIILTGHTSQETIMRAVNEGRVFRYFAKPCHPMELAMAIQDGIALNKALRCEDEEELVLA